MNRRSASSGFTLIEMSIVLVIIGLIVGGVLAGQDLIKGAKLRSVITDIERFNTAVNTFRGKYNCLPGDCPNATAYFGTWAHCSYGYAIPADNGTCNGNNDGTVLLNTTATGNYWAYDETLLFWQQLSAAHLIAGSYSGATDSNGALVVGSDVPIPAAFPAGCYSVNYTDSQSDQQQMPYSAMNSHMFALGHPKTYDGVGGLQDNCGAGGLYELTASLALALDRKIDDGKPFSGSVQTPLFLYGGYYNFSGNSPPGCTNENYGSPPISAAEYATSAAVSACELYFKAAF